MIGFKSAPHAPAQSGIARIVKMPFLWALLAFALHILPGPVVPTHAQGSRKDDIVFNSRGVPLAGATVRVCAMPASGQPCAPLALIYSDPGLTQALANPTTSDGMGNYFFYAAPGQYEIEISGPQITTKQIPNVILPNDPSSPNFNAVSAFSLSLGGNLTVSGNTTVVGNLASGTLNVTNQGTPPSAAAAGTVNVYTKTADKRLYYKDDTGTEIGPLGPGTGAQTNVSNTFTAPQNIDADFHTKGPNPYADITRYGGRLISGAAPSATATCTSGSPNVSLSGAVAFVNGDGITIYNCGAAHSMSTPAAPAVAPSNSIAGTGTGAVTPSPSGSVTACYKVVARNTGQGITAAGSSTCTTTGQTLGAQALTITSLSKTNQTVTVTTTTAPNAVLSVGAEVIIGGTTDQGDFGGKYLVTTVTGTTFSYSTTLDSRGGGATSATGGTATYFNVNHITWPAVTGASQYAVYYSATSGGTYAFLGMSKLQTTIITDPSFDDYGSTIMANPARPAFFPFAAPASATNNSLTTTIASGAGTTNLTLAANAANTGSGTAVFDDGPAIAAAAATGGAVYMPVGGSVVVNSYTTLPSQATIIGASNASLSLNDTLQLGSETQWYGAGLGSASAFSQFAVNAGMKVNVANANPGVYGGTVFHDVDFNGVFDNVLWQALDNNQGLQMERVSFVPGGLSQPAALIRNGNFDMFFDHVFTSGSQTATYGTPALMCNACGNTIVKNWIANAAGIWFNGDWIHIKGGRIQGNHWQPFLTLAPFGTTSPGGAGSVGFTGPIEVEDYELDTGEGACVANLSPNQAGVAHGFISIKGGLCNSSGGNPNVTGIPTTVYGPGSSARNVWLPLGGSYGSNGNGHPTYGSAAQGQVQIASNVNVSAGNGVTIPFKVPTPTAATTTSGCGGSFPAAGTYYYVLTVVGPDGVLSTEGSPSNSVTVDGATQCVNVSWTDAPGVIGYKVYANVTSNPNNGQQIFAGGCNSFNTIIQSNSCIDNKATGSGSGPALNGTGNPSIYPGLLTTNKVVLGSVSAGSYGTSTLTGNFSAPRQVTWPDNSGFVPVSGYQNSAYDNFNRANGAIGSNWTVTQNGVNVTSNVIQGTTAGNTNSAFWNQGAFSNFGQFSQSAVTALNGTTDFIGPSVFGSGSSPSPNFYDCIEDTATLVIQKVASGTRANLTSGTVTGSAGDVLRLEVVPNSLGTAVTLTCYQNGVQQLQTTDSSSPFTSGSPGVMLFGNVATLDNWSGGNLHPLAHLDLEQDWSKPQHFTQGVAFGSETFTASPRAEQSVFLPGALTSTWTGSTWTLDKALTVTRVQVQAKTAPSGCTTNAVVRLTDGTSSVNVTISAAANDSGPITQNYAAGASLTIAVQTAAAGCTTSPADANVVVQYRMQ